LLRRIRQAPEAWLRRLPALAVSAYAREEDRIRSLAVGFQMHITKPFEPLDLTSAVGHLVPRYNAASENDGSGAVPDHSEPPRVLIVEDDADLRFGLHQLLESAGYGVDVAENGLEGVERAIERRPRIALIDLGLPRLDGCGVAERIRKFLPRGEIVLVALTGRSSPDDLQRIVSSGFDDYLVKPISFDRVEAVVAAKLAVASRRDSEESGQQPRL